MKKPTEIIIRFDIISVQSSFMNVCNCRYNWKIRYNTKSGIRWLHVLIICAALGRIGAFLFVGQCNNQQKSSNLKY